MPYRPFTDQNCSIAGALAVVGERWTLLVMREVLLGRRRFREIRRRTGIAPNILSDRLQTLVEHGLLVLRDDGEYFPTQKGLDVNPVLVALMQWGDRLRRPRRAAARRHPRGVRARRVAVAAVLVVRRRDRHSRAPGPARARRLA